MQRSERKKKRRGKRKRMMKRLYRKPETGTTGKTHTAEDTATARTWARSTDAHEALTPSYFHTLT